MSVHPLQFTALIEDPRVCMIYLHQERVVQVVQAEVSCTVLSKSFDGFGSAHFSLHSLYLFCVTPKELPS
jgi:hypothetical protein